ncbi:hypothetical protein PoB_007309000 [Plakobranchus ocellatus]|uniref:Uncharacterized protein n=1 Tax=Plakobranchus ocellatus TaxID=259542 RepID=A0AAV4DR21_9GAST|nr:hypothetical protein PoB_007309000 [Plakobranchus ocellatus]
MREANQSYQGHYIPLVKVHLNKRKAKSLGLLDPFGQLNFQFQHPDPLPQNDGLPVALVKITVHHKALSPTWMVLPPPAV